MKRFILLFIIIAVIFNLSCPNPINEQSTENQVETDAQPITGIKGVVSIEGLEDASNVVIVAEKLFQGKTATVNSKMAPQLNLAAGAEEKLVFSTLSDQNGNYELKDLSPGLYTVSAAKKDTLGAVYPNILVTLEQVQQVDIVLTATGSISGTVQLAGATTGLYGTMVYAESTSYIAMTGDDGSFTIENIPVGTYNTVCYHEGYINQVVNGVEVNGAEDTILDDVDLEEAHPFGVVRTYPEIDDTYTEMRPRIMMYFNELIDPDTVSSANISLNDGIDDISIDINIPLGNIIYFYPDDYLEYSTIYTVTITTGLQSVNGETLESDYSWGFTTHNGPPEITATDPADEEEDVSVTTDISITFDREMDPDSFTEDTFEVRNYDSWEQVAGTISFINPQTVTFDPDDDLEYSTYYEIEIYGVRDANGVYLGDYNYDTYYYYEFDFYTEPQPILPGEFGTWIQKTVDDCVEHWFYFDATVGLDYTISWDDASDGSGSYDADISVSAYREDKSNSYFEWEDDGFTFPQTITAAATERIYIYVEGCTDEINPATYALRVTQL